MARTLGTIGGSSENCGNRFRNQAIGGHRPRRKRPGTEPLFEAESAEKQKAAGSKGGRPPRKPGGQSTPKVSTRDRDETQRSTAKAAKAHQLTQLRHPRPNTA